MEEQSRIITESQWKEYKKLKKNLSEAEEYCDYSIKNRMDLTRQITAHLERIERLEEQLNEANEIIKKFYWKDRGESSSYIRKWSVK